MPAMGLVVALLLALAPAPPAEAVPAPSDAPYRLLDTAWLDSVTLSQDFNPAGSVSTVLIAREDNFADSLASAGGQALAAAGGLDAPLLLVPSGVEIPEATMAEIDRVTGGAPATAIVLGGTAAVPETAEQQLRTAGYTVERVAGAGRHATAVLAARRFFPAGADTVVLARAYGTADPASTAGFADSIAAGAYAAENGHPVLLTNTEQGDEGTLDYLRETGPDRIVVAGGVAAVSEAAAQQALAAAQEANPAATLQRVAGPDRAATAVAFAELRGHAAAGDAPGAVVLDGFDTDAWIPGFVLARYSARTGSPILLGGADGPSDATRQYLAAAPADGDRFDLVCGLGGRYTPEVCRDVANTVMTAPDYAVECTTAFEVPWGTDTFEGCESEIGGIRVRWFPPRNGAAATHIAPYFHGSSAADWYSNSAAITSLTWRDGVVPLLLLAPGSPQEEDGYGSCCHWDNVHQTYPNVIQGTSSTILSLADHFGVVDAPLLYSSASSGSYFLSGDYIPAVGGGDVAPGVYAIMCGPSDPGFEYGGGEVWDPSTNTDARDRSKLLFLYGDQDFLYDSGAAMRSYQAAGFEASEIVYPGGTHCAEERPEDVRAFWDAHS